jgi:hypothetical protein
MKKQHQLLPFLGGALLGVALTLCLGAADKTPAPAPARPALSGVQAFAYPRGTTGFFDAAAGRLYLYDDALANCIEVREVTALGAPLRRVRY